MNIIASLLHTTAILCIATGFLPGFVNETGFGSNLNIQRLDAFIEAEMFRNKIPGLAVAITQGDRILYLQGYGSASSNQPVTPNTPFYIGSVSKSFTALAVMLLVDEGKLDLDTPVQTYLPWFKVADETHSSAITVRHLLNQTSGLGRGDHNHDILSPQATIEEAVSKLKDVQPSRPPGENFQYFNANYTILGLLIERVSGQSYGEYLQKHIFDPLEMAHTFTAPAAATEAGLAQGHTLMLGFPLPKPQLFLAYDLPAGFIITTAKDMAHYLIAQGNGGRYKDHQLISPGGMQVMHQSPGGIGNTYAMGWETSTIEGVNTIQHSGSLETFFARAILLPEQGYGLAILINQSGLLNLLSNERITDDIVRLLLGKEPQGGPSLSLIYSGIAAIMAIDLVRHIYAFFRVRKWQIWAQNRSTYQMRLSIAWNLVVPVLILVVLPALFVTMLGLAATQVLLFYYLADIGLWIAIGSILSLVRGVFKVHFYRELKGGIEAN